MIEMAKKCPFCGSYEQLFLKITKDSVGTRWHKILCYECRCSTGEFQTKEEAIEAWNTRSGENENKRKH